MTKTINITQEILDSLPSGDHILTVTATSESGFNATDTASFSTVSNPVITVDPDLGTHTDEFTFDVTLSGLNGSATLFAMIEDKQFYQLNYAYESTYRVKVNSNLMFTLGGGEHQITLSLTDKKGKTATATTVFTKRSTKPVVSTATNLGDKIRSFAIALTIKNARSEHPSLAAYMDSLTDLIYQVDDASNISGFPVNINDLSIGSHTVIIAVTNDAGTTTKNVSFNVVGDDVDHLGLKLGYKDDTWDKGQLDNRIYEETTVRYEGVSYKSFEDRTPYETEGEVVTGGLLAALSRGIQDASSSNFVRNSDGTYTETSMNGVSNITVTSDGYIEVYTDREGNVLTKHTFFNSDGTVAESTSFERA